MHGNGLRVWYLKDWRLPSFILSRPPAPTSGCLLAPNPPKMVSSTEDKEYQADDDHATDDHATAADDHASSSSGNDDHAAAAADGHRRRWLGGGGGSDDAGLETYGNKGSDGEMMFILCGWLMLALAVGNYLMSRWVELRLLKKAGVEGTHDYSAHLTVIEKKTLEARVSTGSRHVTPGRGQGMRGKGRVGVGRQGR